ncbi:hypothetical protein A2V71_00985 [Candidatus Berkelbacteria bacterium RBG_13_40_8]|uniref:Uncharacterized protein n=1 Tax=Candidatus Berkelbacteria bacterium RBG_13_40_8 TaxID=1797467 RepID=A0A1F5DP74_9BACT|nr:MAG: hypothetical protein A2V71_00985 [Candidatus Berkelbacteria bacterium RBG_13_40_8]
MQAAFLIIISLLGAAYALWTKQGKVSFGFLILAIASSLNLPNLVEGVWVDVLGALSLVLFTVGVFVIVWKPKEIIPEAKDEETKK